MNLNATIFGQIISFVLFVWFCMKYIWGPLITVIEKRQKEVADSLFDARNAKIESDRIRGDALLCLKEAKIKAQEIVSNAHVCKVQILDEAKYEADQERNRILLQTREQIICEKRRAMEELKIKIGQLVIEVTEKIVEKSMDKKKDKILVDNIIAELSHYDEGDKFKIV